MSIDLKKSVSNNIVLLLLILVIFFSLASVGIFMYDGSVSVTENQMQLKNNDQVQGEATLEILERPQADSNGDVGSDS
jgi:flagellar basal body-associated protein FliL